MCRAKKVKDAAATVGAVAGTGVLGILMVAFWLFVSAVPIVVAILIAKWLGIL